MPKIKSIHPTLLAVCFFGVSVAVSSHVNANTTLLGDWVLNVEETKRLAPELPKAKATNSGFGSGVYIGVGGVGIPTPGGSQSNPQAGGLKMPQILACKNLNLTNSRGQEIHMLCDEQTKVRRFKIGKHHGRTAKWTQNKLTESYTSTSRRVKHEFKLKKNQLHVKVMVKPKGGKRLNYIVVFDPKPQENPTS